MKKRVDITQVVSRRVYNLIYTFRKEMIIVAYCNGANNSASAMILRNSLEILAEALQSVAYSSPPTPEAHTFKTSLSFQLRLLLSNGLYCVLNI